MRSLALIQCPFNGGLECAEGLLSGLKDVFLVDLEGCGGNFERTFFSFAISFVLLLFYISIILVDAVSVEKSMNWSYDSSSLPWIFSLHSGTTRLMTLHCWRSAHLMERKSSVCLSYFRDRTRFFLFHVRCTPRASSSSPA